MMNTGTTRSKLRATQNVLTALAGNASVGGYLRALGTAYGPEIALATRRESLCYSEMVQRAFSSAHAWKNRGLKSGSKIALIMESCPDWPITLFALWLCEAVVVPIDVKLTPNEILKILSHVEIDGFVLGTPYQRLEDDLKTQIPAVVQYSPPSELSQLPSQAGSTELEGLLPDALALIVYTSGTSADPKGVMIRLGSLFFQTRSLVQAFKPHPSSIFLSILPLNHLYEMVAGMLSPLTAGNQIIYAQTLLPTELVEIMCLKKVTDMVCVPLFLSALKKSIQLQCERSWTGKLWLSCTSNLARIFRWKPIRRILFWPILKKLGGRLTHLESGGAALNATVAIFFERMGIDVFQGYGLTETSPVVATNLPSANRIGTVGRPFTGVEIKLGPTGEIATRGPHVMLGYYKRDELTKESIDSEGWFWTGDVGRVDADGFLTVTGRSKDIIVLGNGKKVFPDEIEATLLGSVSHILVKDLCVIGALSKNGITQGAEEVCAVIVPSSQSVEREKVRGEILKACSTLAAYKRPSRIVLFDRELPKNTTQKVRREALKKLVSEREWETV